MTKIFQWAVAIAALTATGAVAAPVTPASKVHCPKGPGCESFKALVAAGDKNVLNATWVCFWTGKAPVDPGEDDPPAGKSAQDRFFLIHYDRPPTADSDTTGDVYEQLVRYGKTDDSDHISGWKTKYAGSLQKAIKDAAHLTINYGSLWMVYNDRPASLTFDTIEYNMPIVRCQSLARQKGKSDADAKAECAGLSNKFTVPERAWERKILKQTGAFTDREVPIDKELKYLKASRYAGKCWRLK